MLSPEIRLMVYEKCFRNTSSWQTLLLLAASKCDRAPDAEVPKSVLPTLHAQNREETAQQCVLSTDHVDAATAIYETS